MRQRLANANDYFRRKASEVFNDKAALDLLEVMHRDVVVDISDLDICEHGLSLAKLTAANFCEIGAKVVYIIGSWSTLYELFESTGGQLSLPSKSPLLQCSDIKSQL